MTITHSAVRSFCQPIWRHIQRLFFLVYRLPRMCCLCVRAKTDQPQTFSRSARNIFGFFLVFFPSVNHYVPFVSITGLDFLSPSNRTTRLINMFSFPFMPEKRRRVKLRSGA